MSTTNNNNANNNEVNNFNVSVEYAENQKTLKKQASQVAKLAQTIGQAVKAFGGLGNIELEKGICVNDWFKACGVDRTPDKNGKIPSLGVKHLRAAWAEELMQEVTEEGKVHKQMCIYKNHTGKVTVTDGKGQVNYPAYALMPNGKYAPLSQYCVTPIADDRWTARVITEGLLQSATIEKHVEKEQKLLDRLAIAVAFYYKKETALEDGRVQVEYVKCTLGDIEF